MKHSTINYLFLLLISLTIFSIWAAFALLIVNKFFVQDLPGYTIGRICIWEVVAFIVAVFIAKLLINNWGGLEIKQSEKKQILVMDSRFGIYFGIYF